MKLRGNGFLNKLKQKGYTSEDIPKAIIFHEFLGIAMLALTWSYCYFCPPSQSAWLQKPISTLKRHVPQVIASKVSENGFLTSRVGSSYVESSCLRKLIRPLTLPAKIFLTFKFVDMVGSQRRMKTPSIFESEKNSQPISCFDDKVFSQSLI